ncbi:MAG: hscB [Burkholderiaceae bacterium]|nr:hscB [Burkholderiaceae bacterium]
MQQNYFELFQLPVSFDVDTDDLASRHRAIIARVHPDQFAHKSAMEQRVALQWATFANEAFDTLKSPIARAQYLLKLNAPELAVEGTRVNLPHEFLMQQMVWREAMEEGAGESVREEVEQLRAETMVQLANECAGQNWDAVAETLAKSQFIENFIGQL